MAFHFHYQTTKVAGSGWSLALHSPWAKLGAGKCWTGTLCSPPLSYAVQMPRGTCVLGPWCQSPKAATALHLAMAAEIPPPSVPLAAEGSLPPLAHLKPRRAACGLTTLLVPCSYSRHQVAGCVAKGRPPHNRDSRMLAISADHRVCPLPRGQQGCSECMRGSLLRTRMPPPPVGPPWMGPLPNQEKLEEPVVQKPVTCHLGQVTLTSNGCTVSKQEKKPLPRLLFNH